MSERRILSSTFTRWLSGNRRRFGEDWMGEMSWKEGQIIHEFTRYAGFMYASTKDFTQWLDDKFDSVIQETMKKQGKTSLVGLEM